MLWDTSSYVATILNKVDVVMSVGIAPHEKYKDRPQHVVVSAKLFFHKGKINATDINDCVNYAVIRDFIASWADRDHVDLIETLGDELIEKCFEDSRVEAVWIAIEKPDIFHDAESVGIEVYRTRADQDK